MTKEVGIAGPSEERMQMAVPITEGIGRPAIPIPGAGALTTEEKEAYIERHEVYSSAGPLLCVFKNIYINLYRTQSTNQDPVSFITMSYELKNSYKARPRMYIDLFDRNDTKLVEIDMNIIGVSCGRFERFSHQEDVDPKYFDPAAAPQPWLGRTGGWLPC